MNLNEKESFKHYRRYPKYKNSGIGWFQNVPIGWDVRSAKYDFEIQLGKMLQPEPSSSLDELVPYLRAMHVQWDGVQIIDIPSMWASYSDKIKYAISKGDLLVCEGGDVGRASLISDNPPTGTIIQNALHRVRTKGGSSVALLFYILRAASSQDWFLVLCNRATIAHFTAEKFGSLKIPIPTPTEQFQIVSFLDRKRIQIDDLISKKEKLILFLKEKRSARITSAVTKGLNPHSKLKKSRVEWLGDVPENWSIKKLKRMWKRADYGISESLSGKGPIRVLTMGNIQGGEVIFPDSGSIFQVEQDLILDYHDLLFNRTNSRELVAKVGLFRGQKSDQITFASYLVRLKCKDDVSPIFANYLLNSSAVISIAQSLAFLSINQANLNPTRYGDIKIALPSFTEQQAIATFLDRETSKIDTLILKVQQGIDRLKEYRSALISAAVTGKIDVREESRIPLASR